MKGQKKVDYHLTEREKEVLNLLARGFSNKEISDKLSISVHTTKAHLESIYYKLQVTNRVQTIIKAAQENIINIENAYSDIIESGYNV